MNGARPDGLRGVIRLPADGLGFYPSREGRKAAMRGVRRARSSFDAVESAQVKSDNQQRRRKLLVEWIPRLRPGRQKNSNCVK
jgi:hypothetical protein